MFSKNEISTYKELASAVLKCRWLKVFKLSFLVCVFVYSAVEVTGLSETMALLLSIMTFIVLFVYELLSHIKMMRNIEFMDKELDSTITASLWDLYKIDVSEIFDEGRNHYG